MNDGEFTKRELLFSIVIVCIFLVIGCLIHTKINNSIMEKQQKYNQAAQIDNDKELFIYGMQTNIGPSFVYGELNTIDPVSFPELANQYSYVKKVKEKYTRHTRTVTKTRTVNGKSQSYTTTETYYSWDEVDSWSKHATKISFLGVEFDYGKIHFPSSSYIDTIKESRKIRYVYYGSEISYIGTIYTTMSDNDISECSIYQNTTIEEVLKDLNTNCTLILFWIGWIILTGFVVFGFGMLDNYWLED